MSVREWDEPATLTPLGYAVSSAARTLAWALVAFFIGLALVLAFTQGAKNRCANLAAEGNEQAYRYYGCDRLAGTSWTR
jgi:hypothetical protein